MRHLMADVEFRCHVFCYNVSVAVVVFVVLLCLCLVLESMFSFCRLIFFSVLESRSRSSCLSILLWLRVILKRLLRSFVTFISPPLCFVLERRLRSQQVLSASVIRFYILSWFVRSDMSLFSILNVTKKHASSTTSTVLESRWRSRDRCRLCLVLVPLVEGQLMTSLLAGRYRQHRDDVELVHAVIVWLCLLCIYVVVIHVARKQVVYVTHESYAYSLNVSWEFYASILWRQSQR